MSTAEPLAGKVIVVVGASAGIGADTARVLAGDGAALMLVARTEAPLAALTEELAAAGHDVAYRTGDVSSAADVGSVVDATVARFGRLDGAFNNAAMTQAGRLDAVPEADFDRIMAVNVKGTWLCLREEVRVMERQGFGSIVNVSSIGGLRGSSGMGAYQATKHAVIGLTRTAAHDFGPSGVRVNVIAPGPTETPMLDQLRQAIPGGVEARINSTPLRKVGTGTEVGATVGFLLSDRASHLSGVVLPVDGGFVA
ncbi:SDR family NAD(P)-dependent oxidoreductase [Pseudonocardia sp. KRD291]|uniref:SDR family NAD(P)-dependent oxidoreductase n=1 Tax=Pseudonocardia sp. KRD291 TaxID=2792007 RepID=UPI001C49CF5C|nr:SDR family NAD(P)-dependent oxidoreductase [Pseudonocardia sp. KRD291]MBW0105131.1 SDR family oxidoreductase [Pseudonocardia sp. KRD291]